MAAPPAVLGGSLAQEDTRERQRLVNLIVDDLSANTIAGITINGGRRFDDTLGGFYPAVINPAGGVTLNGSDTNTTALAFHNTATSITDGLLFMANSGNLIVVPNTTSSTNQGLIVADRTGTFMGWQILPAYTSGTTHPALVVNDPPGTATVPEFNFTWYGYQFVTNYYANYVTLSGAAVSGTPYLQAAGSDTNIGIQLIPKGTGAVFFSTHYANYTWGWGAAAGSAPSFGVSGSDTNINIAFTAKGTGVAQFNYASVALGGGAAPTFGTIGGSGPGTAGQNSWWKVNLNGTNYFIPVWV